jgi:hypothetical protein
LPGILNKAYSQMATTAKGVPGIYLSSPSIFSEGDF